MKLDWQKTIETFVATIAGALVAISTIFIQQHFEERRNLMEWFEASYIEQGIDVVMGYTSNIQVNRYVQIQKRKSVPFTQTIPIDALSRLETIVGDKTYTLWIFFFKETAPELVKDIKRMEARQQLLSIESQMIGKVHESLTKVRQVLLDAKISMKRDIYTLRENAVIKAEIKEMSTTLKDFAGKL